MNFLAVINEGDIEIIYCRLERAGAAGVGGEPSPSLGP